MKAVCLFAATLGFGVAYTASVTAQDRLPRQRDDLHEDRFARPPASVTETGDEHLDDRHADDGRFGPGDRPNRTVRGSGEPHDEHAQDGHEQVGRTSDRGRLIHQRSEALANELEAVMERLEDQLGDEHGHDAGGGPGGRQLFAQADAAMRAAIGFGRTVQSGGNPQESYVRFKRLDGQVHSLLEGLRPARDPGLRRSAARVAYADEQLHALIAPPAAQNPVEFVVRRSEVLASEARQFERAARTAMAQAGEGPAGGHPGDRELLAAAEAFAGEAEHFHEEIENAGSPKEIAGDFAEAERGWYQVVDQLNRNAHSGYLYRRAQRVDAAHEEICRLVGARGQRPVLRFEEDH